MHPVSHTYPLKYIFDMCKRSNAYYHLVFNKSLFVEMIEERNNSAFIVMLRNCVVAVFGDDDGHCSPVKKKGERSTGDALRQRERRSM